MMKLRKKILLTAGLIGITTPIMAETSYQCLSCPAGTYSVAGSTSITSCKSIGTLNSIYTNRVSPSQGSCSTGTILAGNPYRVVLRGGKGGNSNNQQGANGGFVEYEFLPNANYSYELCAGGNGGNATGSAGGGGGAGSWLKLTDKISSEEFYIVAGGGGGGASKYPSAVKYSGGGGGGIGAGGSAESHTTCEKCGFLCFTCKKSASHAGGIGGVAGPYGSDGQGLVNGGNVVKQVCVDYDSDNGDILANTTQSQRGGGGMYSPLIYDDLDDCDSKASYDMGYTVSVKLFGDTVNTDIALGGNGGFSTDNYSSDFYIPASEGKASHKTNVSTLSGKCSGTTGCAVLLSL